MYILNFTRIYYRIALLPDIYFDSEQFMWPNIEEILLTMFLFLQ